MNQDPPPEYLLWLLMIVLAVSIVFLPGCTQIENKHTQNEYIRVCALKPIKQVEDIYYVYQQCADLE